MDKWDIDTSCRRCRQPPHHVTSVYTVSLRFLIQCCSRLRNLVKRFKEPRHKGAGKISRVTRSFRPSEISLFTKTLLFSPQITERSAFKSFSLFSRRKLEVCDKTLLFYLAGEKEWNSRSAERPSKSKDFGCTQIWSFSSRFPNMLLVGEVVQLYKTSVRFFGPRSLQRRLALTLKCFFWIDQS